MDQTKWILGGGLVILFIAGLLFVYSGDNASKAPDVRSIPQVEINTATTSAENTQTKESMTITQPTNIKMEPKTLESTTAILHTTMGNITLKLYANDSPKTVENFVKLAKSGFYNGVKFHRVIKDFMIQTGDPLSKDDSQMGRWGTGGPGYAFSDEFNQHKLVRGSLAMANSGPNSNGSQFFIVTAASTPWLDGKHTNFGEVADGMDVVMKIDTVPTTVGDRPVTPVIITSVEIR